MTGIDTAAIRERAADAQASRNDIARCEFMNVAPSRISYRYIAASQADVPALCDEIDRLRDERDRLAAQVQAVRDVIGNYQPEVIDFVPWMRQIRAALGEA